VLIRGVQCVIREMMQRERGRGGDEAEGERQRGDEAEGERQRGDEAEGEAQRGDEAEGEAQRGDEAEGEIKGGQTCNVGFPYTKGFKLCHTLKTLNVAIH